MKTPHLDRYLREKARKAEKVAKKEAAKAAAVAEKAAAVEASKAALQKALGGLSPKMQKAVRKPRRPRGRTPPGGVSRKEVKAMRRRAAAYLRDPEGMQAFEEDVQRTALVILLIDGVLGTEPWRIGGHMGGWTAATARVRYVENASRLLAELRQSRGQGEGVDRKMLDGVIDAIPVNDGQTTP